MLITYKSGLPQHLFFFFFFFFLMWKCESVSVWEFDWRIGWPPFFFFNNLAVQWVCDTPVQWVCCVFVCYKCFYFWWIIGCVCVLGWACWWVCLCVGLGLLVGVFVYFVFTYYPSFNFGNFNFGIETWKKTI